MIDIEKLLGKEAESLLTESGGTLKSETET